MRSGSAFVAFACLAVAGSAHPRGIAEFVIEGDSVPVALAGVAGDAARGKQIVLDRREGNCVICHQFPIEAPFQGEIGPPMAGIGSRLSPGQIRLRLIDQSRLRPDTLMPPYHRTAGLNDVAAEYEGRPALDTQQIEDVVAYLVTLTDP